MVIYNYTSMYTWVYLQLFISETYLELHFVLILQIYEYLYKVYLQLYEYFYNYLCFSMNLNMIRPKTQTEDLLLSITKNFETLIQQTHRKPEETLEFKMTKSRETFNFNPPIQVKEDWMLGLVDLEVYNSIYNITEKNNKFEIYKFPDEKAGGVTYEKVRDEIEKDLDIEDITAEDLRDDIIAPIIIEEYRKQVAKRMKDDKYMFILNLYVNSVFQDFESYLRTEVDLVEDDITLVLDEYNSSFITYELQPGIYTFKDISEALYNIVQSEYPGPGNVIDVEYDDITMKTKLIVRYAIIAIRFDENFFLVLFLVSLQVGIINPTINILARKL